MNFTFILNPRSGRGSAERRLRRLEIALDRAGLESRILLTEHSLHAVDLARQAAQVSDVVVAVGGDGTVHEVVSGVVCAEKEAHFAVIPSGSGNDFAKMFDVPRDFSRAIQAIRNAQPVRVDYGRIRWEGPEGGGTAIFANAAGAGIDAKVAAAATGIKYLTGTPRYLVAVFKSLKSWTAPPVEVELLCGSRTVKTIRSEVLLVGAGNGRCAAGGFYLTPGASVSDGRIDALIVKNASVRRILALIPKVLRGRHVGEAEVTIEQVERIVVRPDVPLGIEADGEVLTLAASEITFEVAPAGLSVMMPVKT